MAVAAVCALALAACGDDSGDDATAATPAATSATTAAAATTTVPSTDYGPTSAAPAKSTATVQLTDNPKLGKILVDSAGRTLYLFEKDTGTTTACTGGCVAAWPAVASATAPTAGPGVDASKLGTAAGMVPNQVVYNGHLLYYFAKDVNPGEIAGTAIPAWYAVDATGTKVEAG
jgi:predicted lipoprotein with Yx(FWY)xxD motif